MIAAGMLGTKKAFTGPLWVQIGIANPCNHRCIMCWDHPSYVSEDSPYPTLKSKEYYEKHPEIDRDKGFMDLEMLAQLADDLHHLGTRRVELAGRGEPTLHPKLNQVLEILKARKFNIGIVTNGSMITPELCRDFIRYGVERIVVSLDAGAADTYPHIHTRTTTGDYERVIHNLQVLRDIKKFHRKRVPHVVLSFVISRLNWREALQMIERGNEAGVDYIVFKYVIPYPNIGCIELTEEEKRRFSSQLPTLMDRSDSYGIELKIEPPIGDMTTDTRLYHRKAEAIYSKIPCYIGWYFALITAEGSVIPCCQCMEQMGNLQKQRFREIWRSELYSDFRQKMKQFPKSRGNPNCGCNECAVEKINMTIYNLFHFYNPIHLHDAQRQFKAAQLLPAILRGKTIRGARAVRNPLQK